MLPTVTQSSLVLKGTVRDTVDPSRALTDAQVRETMARVGLADMALHLDANTLSAGELQLASFARAVASVTFGNAKILLLDEASSSIDRISEQAVSDLLAALRGVTTVVIAHRTATILACDKIALLSDGRLVEYGDPQELMRPGTAFHRLISSNDDNNNNINANCIKTEQ